MTRSEQLSALLTEAVGDRALRVTAPPTQAGFWFGYVDNDPTFYALFCMDHVMTMAEHLDDQTFGFFAVGLAAFCQYVIEHYTGGVVSNELLTEAKAHVEVTLPASAEAMASTLNL